MSQPLLDEQKITSVQDAPGVNLPPSIDGPPIPTNEVWHHTGHKNVIDPQVYEQNIFVATVEWSVNDEAGKLLWVSEVNAQSNPLTSFLSGMYHYYKGGFVYMIKVMGSAFHAGQVSLTVLPPDANPTELSGTRGWTAYNWVAVDPKHIGPIEVEVRDVNQGSFHFTDPSKQGLSPLKRIGWIAMFVDSRLNTTTSGTQQISIEIWCKPTRDFMFSYLRIPRPSETPSVGIPAELAYLLNFSLQGNGILLANSFVQTDKITVFPKTIKSYPYQPFNQIWVDGTHTEFAFLEEPGYSRRTIGNTKWDSAIGASEFSAIRPLPITNTRTGQPSPIAPPSSGRAPSRLDWNIGQWVFDKWISPQQGHFFAYMEGDYLRDGDNIYMFRPAIGPKTTMINAHQNTKTFTVPVDGEAFFLLSAQSNSSIVSPLSYAVYELFRTKQIAQWWRPGQCAIFNLVDVEEGIPLRKVKLYEEGYFTTTGSDNYISYDIKKLRLDFQNFAIRTSPLRSSSEMRRNDLLIRQKVAY
ncbi:hypothetical protein 2 [Hubei picorna-like virus 69]|uniref:hypothetical protein 2 n=1 Tax=Hubei picorna-like virus 69 TaxID=1923152 RepID=UPI0009097350|nr:hypothetical protein 2 [Hubei picorna-like virus 69]APG78385.1 hypothetical protein 2 [Hubei picorna-like virus 69]